MKNFLIGALVVTIAVIIGIGYYSYQKEDRQAKNTVCTSSCYIFLQDYSVEQPNYNGGDFPDGTIVTRYRKGQIVEGKEGISGCEGAGCIPEKIIVINVRGQNWPVSPSILVSYE